MLVAQAPLWDLLPSGTPLRGPCFPLMSPGVKHRPIWTIMTSVPWLAGQGWPLIQVRSAESSPGAHLHPYGLHPSLSVHDPERQRRHVGGRLPGRTGLQRTRDKPTQPRGLDPIPKGRPPSRQRGGGPQPPDSTTGGQVPTKPGRAPPLSRSENYSPFQIGLMDLNFRRSKGWASLSLPCSWPFGASA